ncbi:hypothetical protein C1H46_028929 [Malus baccata]|uniref:Uncharacterized protein n=1 Tax=Malus baccata TaxID=106549 RepID=A0A540LGB9_MALBA|nr:hypothetical protein C1H46_028929 [Malus baccata]
MSALGLLPLSFLSSRENSVSTSHKYIEKKVEDLYAKCASTIEPSGQALLQTYFLYEPNNLDK